MLNQFFTTGHGITMTSAQTIKNLAKEKRDAIAASISNLSFVNEFRDKVGVDCPNKQVKCGVNAAFLQEYVAKAEKIAQYDRLSAYLGEAIKAKSAALEAANALTNSDFPEEEPVYPISVTAEDLAAAKGITFASPKKRNFTKDDVLSEFTVKELAEYYGCNSESAVYGQLVHADGSFNKARRVLHKIIGAPYEIDYDLITNYVATVDPSMVETVFTTLQGKQRKFNAESNSFANRITKRLLELMEQESARYRKALAEYTALTKQLNAEAADKNSALHTEYATALQLYTENFNSWKQQRINEASELKIVIPDSLNDLFTELDNELKK